MNENADHNRQEDKPPRAHPQLVPPDSGANQQGTSSTLPKLAVVVIGILLASAAFLILIWPAGPPKPTHQPTQASQLTPPLNQQPDRPPRSATEVDDTEDAYRMLEEWAQQKAAAEADRVSAWGGTAYTRAADLARDCSRLLSENRSAPAITLCSDAIQLLGELMADKPKLLKNAADAGLQALEQGDPQQAAEQFQRALAIDPDNKKAATGLQRATKLPEVLALIESGMAFEADGDLLAAQQTLRQAVALDFAYQPAQTALARVEDMIAAGEFQLTMSQALQALADGRLAAAEAALRQARKHRPDNPALLDLEQQLSRAKLAAKLDGLKQKAAVSEQQEYWEDALSACERALGLDSNATFAIGCRDRVKQRIKLDRTLQAILSQPQRLFEQGPLKQARQVYARAAETEPRGPRLVAQLAQLDQLIKQADSEVEVVIQSDGLTDVAIYHVGRLGRFVEKRLVLRTGDYTATGSRNGFRDVRQVLKVRPGSGVLLFTLRCEEPI